MPTSPWDQRGRAADERLAAAATIGALAVGGAVLLARSPRLRRVAWLGARYALTVWLPTWGLTQVREAWAASAPPAAVPALAPPADADHR